MAVTLGRNINELSDNYKVVLCVTSQDGLPLKIMEGAADTVSGIGRTIDDATGNVIGNVVDGVKDGIKNMLSAVGEMTGLNRVGFSGSSSINQIFITGYLPTTFSLNINANWTPPFSGGATGVDALKSIAEAIERKAGSATNGGRALRGIANVAGAAGSGATTGVARLTGLNSSPKMTTRLAYGDPPHLEIQIPFIFVAETDAYTDVTLPIRRLHQLAAPKQFGVTVDGNAVDELSILVPPGPNLEGTGEKISMQLGNVIFFDNIVITSVSATYNSRFDVRGNCIYAQVDVGFQTVYAISREDLQKMYIDSEKEPTKSVNKQIADANNIKLF